MRNSFFPSPLLEVRLLRRCRVHVILSTFLLRDTFPLTDRSRLDIFPRRAPGFFLTTQGGPTRDAARVHLCVSHFPELAHAYRTNHRRHDAEGGAQFATTKSAADAARETTRRINILFRFPLRKRLKHAIYLLYFSNGMFFGRTSKASRVRVRPFLAFHLARRPFSPSLYLFLSFYLFFLGYPCSRRPTTPHI